MTIEEFLVARIAEDEAAAAAMPKSTYFVLRNMDYRASESDGFGYVWTSIDRVLSECAARRRIVTTRLAIGNPDDATHAAVAAERTHILRALASVYVNHPDYQQEWSG